MLGVKLFCLRFIVVLFLFSTRRISAKWYDSLNELKPKVSPDIQVQTVQGLLTRLLPEDQRNQFVLNVDPTLNAENESVVIDSGQIKNTIEINGTSGVAVAFGIQSYLKNCCNIHISWDGNQLALPDILPPPQERSVITSVGWLNYYANVCTFSYSFVWWDWNKWEQHLDWMALNGINFPLAHVGQEIIWRNVFMKLGLSQEDSDAFFTGPAFLGWNRMGNIKNWAGPLSNSWHKRQTNLQKKIIGRMLDFGMTPVLPAFAGHVPDGLQKIYPNASITPLDSWNGFDCTESCVNFVDPTDPLFVQIGSEFMIEMNKTFGLYHAYSADPFNEMTPKTFDPDYINAVGKGIYTAMATVDTKAVWVMQAWMFYGTPEWRDPNVTYALTSSVPLGNLLFLDLYAEEYPIYPLVNSYDGQPFIWCMLHNFGGKDGLFGSVQKVNEGLYTAVQFNSSSLVGTGLTMEGIYQNYPIYEMALDLFWSDDARPINPISWVTNMATRRYGKSVKAVESAWELLWTSVYNCTGYPTLCDSYSNLNPVITSRPSLGIDYQFWYEPEMVCSAWSKFISESDEFADSSLYRRDLVDVSRQALQMIAEVYYKNLTAAYENNNFEVVQLYGSKLIQLMSDLDNLLRSDDHFLLGMWVSSAKKSSSSKTERALFEFNSKNQLTLWGPDGEILDYARKQWGGLMEDYYKQRWILFVSTIMQSMINGTLFDQDQFDNDVFLTVEKPFGEARTSYLACAMGDSKELSKKLFDIYFPDCKTVTKNDKIDFSTTNRYAKQSRLKNLKAVT